MGLSRSATIVLAYLINKQNKSLNRAYEHLKSIRTIINPNEGCEILMTDKINP